MVPCSFSILRARLRNLAVAIACKRDTTLLCSAKTETRSPRLCFCGLSGWSGVGGGDRGLRLASITRASATISEFFEATRPGWSAATQELGDLGHAEGNEAKLEEICLESGGLDLKAEARIVDIRLATCSPIAL